MNKFAGVTILVLSLLLYINGGSGPAGNDSIQPDQRASIVDIKTTCYKGILYFTTPGRGGFAAPTFHIAGPVINTIDLLPVRCEE